MNVRATVTEHSPVIEPTWARVEADFYVGSRAGEFLGYIDGKGGGAFRAYDTFSRPVGEFDTVRDAMHAVLEATSNGSAL